MPSRVPPDRFEATYLVETPLDPAKVADIMAGEQSCGTFTRVEGETDRVPVAVRVDVVAEGVALDGLALLRDPEDLAEVVREVLGVLGVLVLAVGLRFALDLSLPPASLYSIRPLEGGL